MREDPVSIATDELAPNWRVGGKNFLYPVAMTFLCSLFGTGVVIWWSLQNVQSEARLQFERRADRLIAEIQRRVNLTGFGLRGTRDLYMGSELVTREEFRAYVSARDFDTEFPGAIGFGVLQRVMRDDLDAFVVSERADSAPEYEVRTRGEAKDLYPIQFIEPLERNREALGFDVGSESRRRAAVEKAIYTGEHTLSQPIDLVQDDLPRAGFLYVVPLYQKGSYPSTPEERMASLAGLLFAPMVIDNIFIEFGEYTEGFLAFDVFDGMSLTARINCLPTTTIVSRRRVSNQDCQAKANRLMQLKMRSWVIAPGRYTFGRRGPLRTPLITPGHFRSVSGVAS